MWYFLQGVVMFAVLASNIHFHWTPNHYLAAQMATTRNETRAPSHWLQSASGGNGRPKPLV